MIAAIMLLQAAVAEPVDALTFLPAASWIDAEARSRVRPYWECVRDHADGLGDSRGAEAAARAGVSACTEQREALDAALTASGLLWKIGHPEHELPGRMLQEALDAVDAAIIAALSARDSAASPPGVNHAQN